MKHYHILQRKDGDSMNEEEELDVTYVGGVNIHNTEKENDAFRRTWDATNAHYWAMKKADEERIVTA